jgi:methylthioribulose-1-phosphate dehydratase
MFTGQNLKAAEELQKTIKFFSEKGWTPATSTNYSVRAEDKKNYLISRSGVDKSKFQIEDFILINPAGDIQPPHDRPGVKSSAETLIHTAIYEHYPEMNCVLHTHSLLGTVLSYALVNENQLVFEGWEIQKGLEGNQTHEMKEVLPIVPNSQNIPDILRAMEDRFTKDIHGFLIAGHGLYTWGKDIATAKRHVETFEFLFECYHTMRRF